MSSRQENNANILFRDLYGLTVVLFVVLAAILLQAKLSAKAEEAADVKMPGNLQATITWPEGDFDIDLWLDGPGEPVPVGYSNKGGVLWNLLRDDLGRVPDATNLNFENAYSRGVPPGKYRINVQCYRCPQLPMVVDLDVRQQLPDGGNLTVLATSKITLNRNHEEKTGLAFTVGADGKVSRESMTTLFEPLRAAEGQK